jgi:ribosomal protein S18 acetylase RimI-like enzyme
MKRKPIVIRKGTEDDLSAFFELYWISSLEHTHYSGVLDSLKPKEKCQDYIINRQQELMKDSSQFFFVAEDEKNIIGIITGHVGERDEARVYRIERIGYVDEVCVHPNYRHSGIGNQLLETMLTQLYKEDIDFVGVGVAFKNPAFHFYKSYGFTPEGMWLIQKKKTFRKKNKVKK